MCSGIEITPKKIHFKEKQKMKKLGLIILMALVLTVGGVYATFNYAQADVDSKSATLNKGIAGTDTETPKGTISINVDDFLVKIDDTGTLKTGLKTQGNVKVTFTPKKGADASVADEGVNLKLEISFTNNTYRQNAVDYEVFKTTGGYEATTGLVLGKGTKNEADGTFEYTVDLGQYLTVSEIPLPTLADYNAFAGWFLRSEEPRNAVITVKVSEVVSKAE